MGKVRRGRSGREVERRILRSLGNNLLDALPISTIKVLIQSPAVPIDASVVEFYPIDGDDDVLPVHRDVTEREELHAPSGPSRIFR